MWSEHCSYKSSKVHLKRLPTRGKLVVQGPGENAGVVDIGDGFGRRVQNRIAQSSELRRPFQGATTGVGGILRDIFTNGRSPHRRSPIRSASVKSRRTKLPRPKTPQKIAAFSMVYSRRRPLRQLLRRAHCWRRSRFEHCYSQNPFSTRSHSASPAKKKFFSPKAKGIGNPVI